jgi:hypothetical protein
MIYKKECIFIYNIYMNIYNVQIHNIIFKYIFVYTYINNGSLRKPLKTIKNMKQTINYLPEI